MNQSRGKLLNTVPLPIVIPILAPAATRRLHQGRLRTAQHRERAGGRFTAVVLCTVTDKRNDGDGPGGWTMTAENPRTGTPASTSGLAMCQRPRDHRCPCVLSPLQANMCQATLPGMAQAQAVVGNGLIGKTAAAFAKVNHQTNSPVCCAVCQYVALIRTLKRQVCNDIHTIILLVFDAALDLPLVCSPTETIRAQLPTSGRDGCPPCPPGIALGQKRW